ncbi:signal peptidase I [Natrialba sp. INN-245]|uniref:signal peptidase I n=1 Tax=Natrialba sp. INN-245 TaxID=2690967 RepID=UPI0013137B37|nr:signal peptidase I [Natrialba sp. INN-245]MWV41696.1 signal peptidase I [Natrialba sp. INN-245]
MNYRKTANVLGLLVLIAIVLPFVIYAVPGVIGAEYSFVVLTGSMAPAIDPGDVVVVDETDPATIESGDVITFARDGTNTPVTHRVVGVADAGGGLAFETKGDANSEVDAGLVPAENVLGVVVLTIPYIGYVIQMTNSTAGFLLLVVVPIVLFAASELWALFRSAREDGERTPPTADSDAGEGDAITLSASDLTLSSAMLVLVVPYVAYVAFELRTALSIAVAVAATLSLLAVGGLWFGTRRDAMDSTGRSRSGADSSRTEEGNLGDDDANAGTEEAFETFVPATTELPATTDGGDLEEGSR